MRATDSDHVGVGEEANSAFIKMTATYYGIFPLSTGQPECRNDNIGYYILSGIVFRQPPSCN